MSQPLSPFPFQDPVVDKHGQLTHSWSEWFNRLYELLKGATVPLRDLAAQVAAHTPQVGSWVPTNPNSVPWTIAAARYQKTGPVVQVWARIEMPTTPNTAQIVIDNLPFPVEHATNFFSGIAASSGLSAIVTADGGTTRMRVFDANVTPVAYGDIPGQTFWIQASYLAAS